MVHRNQIPPTMARTWPARTVRASVTTSDLTFRPSPCSIEGGAVEAMRAHHLPILVAPLLWSTSAAACGVCTLALVDRFCPPAFLWLWWPLAWFVSAAVVAAAFGLRLRGMPGVAGACGIAFAAFVVATTAAGPLATMPLAVPPGLSFFRLVRQRAARDRFGRAHFVTGAVFLAVAGYGVIHGAVVLHRRTDAEYICQWPATGLARVMFRDLIAAGPSAADDLRGIVAQCKAEEFVAEAAEALARVGIPAIDVPLLQDALGRVPPDSETATRIRSAMSALSEQPGGA
jgi:hypothetical protein